MTQEVVPAGTYDTGLDDLTPNDLVVPRLKIKHKDGVFEDGATGEQTPVLYCVILGLVRQRVLFHHNVEDGDVPMCKSPDFQVGYVNLDPPNKKKSFPWERAQFDPNDYPPDAEGRVTLPCAGCKLKDWGTHPVTENKPYCAEQHTLPIYWAKSLEELNDGSFQAGLLTFQKTGIPPSKRYLGTFKQRNVGAYTAVTEISLNMQQRGQTVYCTPQFRKLDDTNAEQWPTYSEHYAGIRHFLISNKPGGQREEFDASAIVDNSAAVVPDYAQQPMPEPAQPMPVARPAYTQPPAPATAMASAPPASDPDDELPF